MADEIVPLPKRRAVTGKKKGLRQTPNAVLEREAAVIALWKQNRYTQDEIAELTGLSGRGAVSSIITRVLNRILVEDVEEVRARELAVMSDLQLAVMGEALTGDKDAIESVLKLMRHRLKLIPGLEAASSHKVELSLSEERMVAAMEKLDELEAGDA